jgi:hypothetical protein
MDAQTICDLARQIAKAPKYTTQSGQLLNSILADLCQTYDFDVIRKTDTSIVLSTGTGSGPYDLQADFIRARILEVFYTINGVKYVMVNLELWEYDALVQQSGINNFPQAYTIDVSLVTNSVPVLLVWPPASGAYPLTIRYQPQMPDITTPETSSSVPWFPNTKYLITALACELMKLTNDDRYLAYKADADDILMRYLKMKDDPEGRAKRVQLDRRFFGNRFNRLPNTKLIGWT